ncbi:MAG: hypothetical protein GWP91_19730 [Rhodobacterales bacterium]|nr:hypothetical protein [Rhodobacterales bacterium]
MFGTRIMVMLMLASGCGNEGGLELLMGDGGLRSADTSLANCTITATAESGGHLQYVDTFFYDANGHQTLRAYDADGDGAPELHFDHTFSGDQIIQIDGDVDNRYTNVNWLETFAYDGNLLVEYVADTTLTDGDAIDLSDYTDTLIWSDSQLVERQSDYGSDGGVDITWTFDWAQDGLSNQATNDQDAWAQDRTWDSDGQLLSYAVAPDANFVQRFANYTYGALHQPTLVESGVDGPPTPPLVYDYHCS